MSQSTSPGEIETYPVSPEEWTDDPKSWMKVACSVESKESTLRFTPDLPQTINFSIWQDATKYQSFDLQESDWKLFVFTHANHLTNLESATITLYHDQLYWEKDILPDLSGDWKTVEYLLPSSAPEGYWKKSGSPTKIKYILFKFSGKSGLGGSFEIKEAHLIHSSPK